MGKTTETKTTPAEAPAAAAETSPVLPVDEFHGVGGSYVMVGGVRTRVAGPPLPDQTPAATGDAA